jgi:hypothetical protein
MVDINELRRNTMSSTKDQDENTSRRAFFQEITAGTAGLAVAGALAQLAVPQLAAAQGAQKEEPKQAVSPFFKDSPPWPEGTNGKIYDHLFGTKLKENSSMPDIVPGPQTYFRGESDLPGAKMNMGWQIFKKPIKLETQSHHHDTDEYLIFLGSTFPDLVGSFDAEIEIFIGTEYERHIINKATVLYVPAGLEHNPCDIRKVNKPMLLSALQLSPYFCGIYQKMGYMAMRSTKKID